MMGAGFPYSHLVIISPLSYGDIDTKQWGSEDPRLLALLCQSPPIFSEPRGFSTKSNSQGLAATIGVVLLFLAQIRK